MKPNLNTLTHKGSQSKNEGSMKIEWSKNEYRMKHEANRPLSRLFFAVMVALLLVGMTAKGQSVIMSGDYYLTHNETGTSVSSEVTNTFNPSTCLWYVNNRYIRTANSTGTSFGGNNYLQNTSLSIGSSSQWYQASNGNTVYHRTGTIWVTYYYLRQNGTTWQVNNTNSNNGYVRNVNINSHVLTDNTTSPVISINSIDGNKINFSHTYLEGSYTPEYTTYSHSNGSSTITHNWYNGTDYGSTVPSFNANTLNPTYTWSLVSDGDGAATFNTSTGVLTINSAPTADITVRLTVSNISPLSDKPVDFTLTPAPIAQNVIDVTEMTDPTMSPTSAALYYNEGSQTFNSSATATRTVTTIPAHTTLTGGGNTYYYYNSTLYASTDGFSTFEETPLDVTLTWSLSGAAASYLTCTPATGNSTTVTHSSQSPSDLTATLTVTASATGVTPKTATATITAYGPMVAPHITRTGNTISLATTNIGATIYYTTDGTTPSASNGTAYTAPFDLVTSPTTVKAITIRDTHSSAVAEETFTITLAKPEITINSTGLATITAEYGADIHYTTDGTTPTEESATYTSPVQLSNEQTIKAIAIKEGFTDSPVAEAQYITSGVSGSKVVLNDLEDHSWSYYSDATLPEQLRSLNPADVKITYHGNGKNTISTTNDPTPLDNSWTQNATTVQVSSSEADSVFIYYKTLERTDGSSSNNPSGRCEYTAIPNPFSVRPTYTYASGTNNNYCGFYKWRVRKLSGGSIYDAASGGNSIGVGGTIDGDQKIYFAPNASTGMEVELEALWARAYVVTSNTTSGLNNSVSYERNFVYLSSNTTIQNGALSYPVTYTTLDPATGAGTKRTITIRDDFTCAADTKFENLTFAQYNNNGQTLTANNHNLIVGRGVTGTVNYVRGISGNISNPNYTIRLESGTFNYISFLKGYYPYDSPNSATDGGGTISGTMAIKAILGCDYDRASNNSTLDDKTIYGITDNLKINYAIFLGHNNTISGNENNETLKTWVKSGKIGDGFTINNSYTAAAEQCMYLGVSSTSAKGNRLLFVEGGQIASVAGGIDSENQGENNNHVKSFTVRMTGGHIRGVLYGGGARSIGSGDRRYVITGGTITGWLGAGCNGESGSGSAYQGQTHGESFVYFGGNAVSGGTGSNVSINGSTGGTVFGAGKGVEGNTLSGQMTYGTNVVIADNCEIENNVYGGGNYGFALTSTKLFITGGTVGGSIFGGSNQNNGPVINITMKGGTVEGGVFGGSNTSGTINNNVTMNISGGTVEQGVFGGGYGTNSNSCNVTGSVGITMTGGTVLTGLYGGGNVNSTISGVVTMSINGGQVGNSTSSANIHGGGLGNLTRTLNSVSITLGTSNTATEYVTVYGDVYGGSAKGKTNGDTAQQNSATTTVTLNKGIINGSLYGGGLGDNTYAADVWGPVQVTVNGGTVTDAVYGCNNANGAPKSTVHVDIYGTDTPSSGYALAAVFGGGNQAAYNGTPVVTVHNCDNSIEYVYGGGNAATVRGTDVTIYGGNTIGNVFGGCYGANVTNSGTDVKIYGGTIGKVFGGNNQSGSITGGISVKINKQTETGHESCAMHIGEVYGGGNVAASQAGSITVNCTGTFTDWDNYEGIEYLYGGANEANITSGNIALNITKGTIKNVFGGNNSDGTISGTITVNVTKADDCMHLYNVYGAGNLAPYSGSPAVNIYHGTVDNNVYGGGKGSTAVVTGNPVVAIGDSNASHCAVVGSDVYGGGDAAAVTGNTSVTYNDNNASSTVGKLFGGGNAAGVSGTSTVTLTNGKVTEGVYGGCNSSGNIGGKITVNVNGGTLGSLTNLQQSTPITVDVFGGGYGESTTTSGDVEVNINGGDIYGDVYGGSALGQVNDAAADKTTVKILNGTLHSEVETLSGGFKVYHGGNVFGGGLGEVGSPTKGQVNGTVTVNIGSGTVTNDLALPTGLSGSATINGNVYGCNNTNGSPQQDVTVNIFQMASTLHNVFGGGNQANFQVSGKMATVNVYTCGNQIGRVFGGGNAAATNSVRTMIQGGTIGEVYGGGNGEVEPANVTGTATLNIHGGAIGQIFAGSNQQGSISGGSTVTVDDAVCETGMVIDEFFCGNNFANIDDDLETTITCSEGMNVTKLYGGCNQADITGHVVLNVYGGTYQYVFGGSKGRPGSNPEDAADIGGYVTLNLYGGTIGNAFGGSDVNGNIAGAITVNVLDEEDPDCPLYITNIYGGSNLTDYTPSGATITSPVVNVVHAKNGISGNVYGGSKGVEGASEPTKVEANPLVNIGYDASMSGYIPSTGSNAYIVPSTSKAIISGSVFGGGDAAKVEGNTEIRLQNQSKVFGNVYGGGNMGEVDGDTKVIVDGANN